MEPFYYYYIAAWSCACLLAVVICFRNYQSFSLFTLEYRRFLCAKWKLVSFVIAALGITLVSPYANDPTWDHLDAFFMSVFAFITAPWVRGTLYLGLRKGKQVPMKQVYVSLCIWMFSVSWSYDLYLVIRDGDYPITWLPNIFASSVLYVAAGLLWNLDWISERGVTFSFMEKNWPTSFNQAVFGKLVWYALPFMTMATIAILYFL